MTFFHFNQTSFFIMNQIVISQTQLNFLVFGVLIAVIAVTGLIFSRVQPSDKKLSNGVMANFAIFLGLATTFNVLMVIYLLGYSAADNKIVLLLATVLSGYLSFVFFLYSASYLFTTKPQATIQKGIVY